MTTLPDWLLGLFLCALLWLAAYGVGRLVFDVWLLICSYRIRRKQDRYYRELCEWAIAEIEKEVRRK